MTNKNEIKDESEGPRTTSPQSPYTLQQVGTGLIIFGIGIVITVFIPLVLA